MAADTTGLASRPLTQVVTVAPQLIPGGRVGHRLSESASSRSFLALGVGTDRPDRVDRALDRLSEQFGVAVLDVTQVLVDAMRAQAAAVGLPWELVRAADAAPTGSWDAAGLTALV
jgi:uncharacterized NAD-dependent epimerase/dehydratase family protein